MELDMYKTIMLTQRQLHKDAQHRICGLICFRTITYLASYFYEHLPPWYK